MKFDEFIPVIFAKYQKELPCNFILRLLNSDDYNKKYYFFFIFFLFRSVLS